MKKILSALLLCLFCFSVFPPSLLAQNARADRPIENFLALWTTFSERYANFDLKQVDWDEVYEQYRPLLREDMTEQELFELMCDMVQQLNDGHVTITADFDSQEVECGPPYEFLHDQVFPTQASWEAFQEVIDATLLWAGFSEARHCRVTAETNFQYRVSEQFGYLRLDEMTEALTFGRFNRALNRALRSFQNKEAIIIDLRFNGGGSDEIAYRLASRLRAAGDTLGHYVRTRIKGEEDFTANEYYSIKPRGRFRYSGPIVLLTSDFTASAAEVFVLLLQELPRVSLVGDTTEGIFSDMYEFRLPNGWEASLSHQQFFSRDFTNYEGIGLVPDVQVVNSRADLQERNDPVITKALQFLNQ